METDRWVRRVGREDGGNSRRAKRVRTKKAGGRPRGRKRETREALKNSLEIKLKKKLKKKKEEQAAVKRRANSRRGDSASR